MQIRDGLVHGLLPAPLTGIMPELLIRLLHPASSLLLLLLLAALLLLIPLHRGTLPRGLPGPPLLLRALFLLLNLLNLLLLLDLLELLEVKLLVVEEMRGDHVVMLLLLELKGLLEGQIARRVVRQVALQDEHRRGIQRFKLWVNLLLLLEGKMMMRMIMLGIIIPLWRGGGAPRGVGRGGGIRRSRGGRRRGGGRGMTA